MRLSELCESFVVKNYLTTKLTKKKNTKCTKKKNGQ
jgi:hypothetical protein